MGCLFLTYLSKINLLSHYLFLEGALALEHLLYCKVVSFGFYWAYPRGACFAFTFFPLHAFKYTWECILVCLLIADSRGL